jgi:threonine dehydratase
VNREHARVVLGSLPESLARISALVDDVVVVHDDDLRSAMDLIAEALGVLVEPAGAAG